MLQLHLRGLIFINNLHYLNEFLIKIAFLTVENYIEMAVRVQGFEPIAWKPSI